MTWQVARVQVHENTTDRLQRVALHLGGALVDSYVLGPGDRLSVPAVWVPVAAVTVTDASAGEQAGTAG